jgi:hypothetical protein
MRGPDLPLLTQKLIQKYILDSDTGAIISVISATVPEVQNAPIFRILADLPQELKSNCICVFAKTDMSIGQDHGFVLCDVCDSRDYLTWPADPQTATFVVLKYRRVPRRCNVQFLTHFVCLRTGCSK